jgi:hypothetical protein
VDEDQVIPFSAHAHIGRDDLAEALGALLAAGPWREEPVCVPRVDGASDAPATTTPPTPDDIDDDGGEDDDATDRDDA